MISYLVERYLPGLVETDVRTALGRVQAACVELSAAGSAVRYLGSIFLPSEEACFCRFDSDHAETVARANEQARLPFARITCGLAIDADQGAAEACPADP